MILVVSQNVSGLLAIVGALGMVAMIGPFPLACVEAP